MNRCFNCGYMWADLDEGGTPISLEYCHYTGLDAWAPCEQDDNDYEDWHSEVEEEDLYGWDLEYDCPDVECEREYD